MKIHAPNPHYTGTDLYGTTTVLDFHDGVAEHDGALPAGVKAYLASAGYGLGRKPKAPEGNSLEVPDPRDQSLQQVGAPLRDAAVNPQPGDFLPPINAGKEGPEGNPHGPNVVAPEIHAGTTGAVAPGPVGRLEHETQPDPQATKVEDGQVVADEDATKEVPVVVPDTDAQEAKESELAERTRIDSEPVPDVVAELGARQLDAGEPKGGAKRDEWVDYARSQGAPETELGELGTEGALSRDDLRAKYGS